MEICECPGSSHIKGHGYDHQTKTMGIQFQGGKIYHYEGVEPHEYEAFKNADSKGVHFHSVIKPKFGLGVKQ